MNVLLIGPPGSGKGTQGERLAQELGIEHLAAGDLLRAEVAAGTPIGQQVAELMERGELVPDIIILTLVLPPVLAAVHDSGYLLDGFPRSVQQAELARSIAARAPIISPHAVFYLDVPRDELVRRILARAQVQDRADDNPETVENRLRVFEQATSPLIEHYRRRGLLTVIDANQDADKVTADILESLDRIKGDSGRV